MMKKKLSDRVSAIIELVPECDTLADIGCDHASISIYLKEIGRVKKVIASDLREKPLEKARENVRKKGFEESFDFRLCSGLSSHEVGEMEVILISGMGGLLMRTIMEEGISVVKSAKYLLLEPQSDMEVVRIFLRENGFLIKEERVVKEGIKYYPVIRAEKREEKSDKNKVIFDKYGYFPLIRKDSFLKEFLLGKREKYREILSKESFVSSTGKELESRLKFLKTELAYVEEALKYYE